MLARNLAGNLAHPSSASSLSCMLPENSDPCSNASVTSLTCLDVRSPWTTWC